jgi:aspartate/methionine/tyrosine aminotransferase
MLDLNSLVAKHRELYLLLDSFKGEKKFISDWNCEHPFYSEIFSAITLSGSEIKNYNYIRAHDDLTQLISNFHLERENVTYSLDSILTSNGSATHISSFFVWIKTQGLKYVYYAPPLYYTFHFLAKIFEVELRPIARKHMFDRTLDLNLPASKCALIITDPIWYSGSPVGKEIIDKISQWQIRTQSTIFVDGSFQYFKWNGEKTEYSSTFCNDNTFRLVCPSKALGTHGLRFSYLLLPERYYETFDFILDGILGSSSAFDISFAKACMNILLSPQSNSQLINYTQTTYQDLIENELIKTVIIPECGYFTFAEVNHTIAMDSVTMDGSFFEQNAYRNYKRINLLNPYLRKLLD